MLSFLFSVKGVIYIGIIALLIWLLKDYPEWRHNKTPKEEEGDEKPGEVQNIKETPQKKEDTTNEKLSLAHYILVSPFAALYIIGRAILDMIRYTIYYTLWSCEKSIPYIDDWLFEFVTVTLPKRYEQTARWWTNQGKPATIRFREYVRHSILPDMIQYTELFFVNMYKFGCAVQSMVVESVAAWRRFIERHDWEQLAQDLMEIAHERIWIPATKCYKLFKLVYIGIRASLVSIVGEIQWICTVLIPSMYQYVASTRIAQWSYLGVMYLGDQIKQIAILVYQHLLVPTIGRFLTWIVQCIDHLVLLLEQHTIHEKLFRLYSILAPQLVWLVIEFSSFMNLLKSGSVYLYEEMIYPAYQLFKKQMMPHLTVLYQKIVNEYMYPAWQKIYPYLNKPVYLCYIHIMVPLYTQLQVMISKLSTPKLVWIVYSRVNTLMATCASAMYGFIQNWLKRQAPVLSKMIQNSWQFVIHSCDWHSLYTEANQLYEWIALQSNLVYASLERSLTTWVQEQQPKQKTL